MKPIDVKFHSVRPAQKRWYHDGDLIELIFNTLCGLGFLGMAAYAVHLFLSNNF